jgi:hypothetical protein
VSLLPLKLSPSFAAGVSRLWTRVPANSFSFPFPFLRPFPDGLLCYALFTVGVLLDVSNYLILEWERRNNHDDRTFGGMFYLFCDEVKDMDLKTALRQLMVYAFLLMSDSSNREEVIRRVRD